MVRSVHDERVDLDLIERRAPSVAHLFRDRVRRSPDNEAFRHPVGDGWASLTWQESGARARDLAAGLITLGVEPEQRVALAAATRLEWVLADLAVMCAGAATTTVYPTTSAADIAYIVADSGSRVVIAEDDGQVAKLREHRDELPDVAKVVTIDGTGDGDWVMTFAELESLGARTLAEQPGAVDERIDALTPDHLATIIYTSGTTGRPKGVRLPHSAWTYEAAAVDALGILSEDDLQFLWLPLAHVFGKVLLALPLQVGFPTAVDGRVEQIVDNLAVVRPTFMGAAPRIFEKAYGRVTTMIDGEGGLKAKLFHWAVGIGQAMSELRAQERTPGALLALQHAVADRLVLRTVRERFGGRVRFFISGSAALNQDVAQWFDAVGMLILEGYGLTETSAASFVTRPCPGGHDLGSVGWALPGTEARIAEDGEIMLRGPGVTRGYHGLEDATREAIDEDAWFRTGDIGTLDDRGFLRITDRKKDLFKTSNGKYVAPSVIEAMFKGLCPYASQLVVEGDGRNFVSAMVTLDPEAIEDWAKTQGLEGLSYAGIAGSPKAREMVQGYIDALNSQLNRWEQIKKFVILDHDLTVETGDLTPSLKLKRRVVTKKYQAELDSLYG